MVKNLSGAILLLGIVAGPAWAQRTVDESRGPRVLVLRCVNAIETSAHFTVRGIATTGNRCSAFVAELVEAGRVDEAQAVAQRCAQAVNTLADNGTQRIDRIGMHCAELLEEAGAPDAAFEVIRRAALAGKSAIDTARDRALAAIRQALGG